MRYLRVQLTKKSMLSIHYVSVMMCIFYIDWQQYWKCDWIMNIGANAHGKRTVSTKLWDHSFSCSYQIHFLSQCFENLFQQINSTSQVNPMPDFRLSQTALIDIIVLKTVNTELSMKMIAILTHSIRCFISVVFLGHLLYHTTCAQFLLHQQPVVRPH